VTLVSMMGLAHRGELATRLIAHGWSSETRAAIVCGASTAAEWTWTGLLADVESVAPPEGIAGVIVVGEVVQVRDALATVVSVDQGEADEVKYGRS
jgi:siroheme synthase